MVLEQRQLKRLKAADAFAIAIDESTDVSLEKHCVIYVKYVYQGRARVEFLGILNLTSGGGLNPYKGNPDKSRKMKQKSSNLNIHDYLDYLGGNNSDSDDEQGSQVVDSDEEEVTLEEMTAAPSGGEPEPQHVGSPAEAQDDQINSDANSLCEHVIWDPDLIPDGHQIMPKPQAVVPRLIRKAKIVTRQGDKWWLGVGKEKIYQGKYQDQFRVQYSHGNQQAHPLLLSDYGVDKWWVLLEEE